MNSYGLLPARLKAFRFYGRNSPELPILRGNLSAAGNGMHFPRIRVYMNASLIIANAALVSLSAFLFLGACSKSIPRPVFSKGHPAAAEDLNSDVKENPTNPDDQDPTKTKGASINPTALKAVMSTSDVSCNGDAGMSDSPPVLRLLTHREYSNSIRDLFEVQSDFGAKLPNENITHGFRNNTAINQVTDSHMPAFLVNARELASEIIPKMDKIANCQVVAGASCAAQFITTIGPRIWRRPLTEAEVMQMRALFQTGAAISNEEGMGLVIRAFLSSPNFVYRSQSKE
ncbi:MAG: DUF1595 domain-containing protein [Proteobacteria bacterium]|nr:MAG: DUF1595 domain-containing protein [Pseudomonadota bacterium]